MSITAIPGLLLYLNNQFALYVLVCLVGFGVAFGLTYMFGYKDEIIEEKLNRQAVGGKKESKKVVQQG